MKKFVKVLLIVLISLAAVAIIFLLSKNIFVSKNENVNVLFKQKTVEVTDKTNIDKIVSQIPLLDYVLDYDNYSYDKDKERLTLKYHIKEGKKITDIYYDNVKYNADIIFSVIKNLREVKLEVTFINDANEEEVVAYSTFRDDTLTFDYNDKKGDYEIKFEEVINKYVK